MPRIVRVPGLDEPLTFPSGTPDAEIYGAVIDKLFPVAPLPDIPKPEAGFFGGFGEGITALGGLPSALGYAITPEAEQRKAAALAATPDVEFQQLSDIEGIGDLGRFLKEQAGQAVGFMAAPVAAAKAASMIPAPLPAKALAASGAFLTTAGAQYLGQTLGRQAQEQEIKAIKGEATEAPEITKALLAAGGQAGLDLYGFRIFKPLGDLIGLSGKEAAERVGKEVIGIAQKEGTEAAARSILGGAAKGAAIEAAQEPIQQLLERWGAGLDISSDEAIQEYFEAAVAGGLLGAPLGGASTFIGNLNAGVYDKKFDPDLSAEQFKSAWNQSKNDIYNQAPVYQFADDTGNFVNYTPDVLTRLGINPEVESLNLEKQSLDMQKDILGKSTEDKDIAKFLYRLFIGRKRDIDRELRDNAEDLTPDRRQELVAEYEQAVAGEKSMFNLLVRQPDVNSPRNFAVITSPKDPKKFSVANMVTGKAVSETEYKTKEEAEKFISNQRKKEESQLVRSLKEEKPKGPITEPTKKAKVDTGEPDPFASKRVDIPTGPTAETQALTNRMVDIQKAFGQNANRVFEKAKQYMQAGLTQMEALNAAEKDVAVELQAAKTPPPPPVDPAQKELEKQRAFIRQDYGSDAERIFQKAQEYETAGATPLKALSSAKKDIDAELAARLKEMVAKRKAEKEAEEAAKKTEKKTKTKKKASLTPEQIVAAEAQGLAEDYGIPGMATAIKTQEDLDAVKDYLAEVERLEGEVVEQKKRNIPTIETQRRVQEMYDRLGAAVEAGDLTPIKPLSTKITPEQIKRIQDADKNKGRKIAELPGPVENIDIDTLTDEQLDAYLAELDKKMPKNKAEVDDIIEQNGNAKQSKKIAKEVKSDICKGGSDA